MIEVLAPKYHANLQPNQSQCVTLTCKAGANRQRQYMQRWILLNPPIQYQTLYKPFTTYSLDRKIWQSEVYCHVPLTCFNAHVASAITTNTSSSIITTYNLILYSINKCTVKNCSLYNYKFSLRGKEYCWCLAPVDINDCLFYVQFDIQQLKPSCKSGGGS